MKISNSHSSSMVWQKLCFYNFLLFFRSAQAAEKTTGGDNGQNLANNSNGWWPDFLNQQPPSGLVWIAIIALVVRIFYFLWQLSRDKRDKILSIEDEYWYRTIFMPICVKPLIEFIDQFVKKIKELDSKYKNNSQNNKKNTYNNYLSEFKIEKESTRSRFLVLATKGSDFYTSVASRLDEIDDIVTQHCALKSIDTSNIEEKDYERVTIVEQNVYMKLRDILGDLKKRHRSKFR